jgi:hypothetical protein
MPWTAEYRARIAKASGHLDMQPAADRDLIKVFEII